jgi:threonine/homoserine/homoserine lactone efflux protein
MTYENILILAIAISLLCFKPGPGMMTIITRALNSGFKPAFAMICGIMTVETIFFIAAATSFTFLSIHSELIANITKSLAIVYLMFLGIKGFMDYHRKGNEITARIGQNAQLAENFAAGAIVTMSNPYVIIFYAAVVPGILEMPSMTTYDHVIALCVITSVNFLLLTSQALLASYLRDLLKSNYLIRQINLFTSLAFIAISLYMTYTLLPIFAGTLGFANM